MTNLIIKSGDFSFSAQLEEEDAPKTCTMFWSREKALGRYCLIRAR